MRRRAAENLILCPPPRRLGFPDSQFVAKQHFLAASRAPLRRGRRDRWRLLLTWLKLKMRLLQNYCSRAAAVAWSIGTVVHRLDRSPDLSFFFFFSLFLDKKNEPGWAGITTLSSWIKSWNKVNVGSSGPTPCYCKSKMFICFPGLIGCPLCFEGKNLTWLQL